MLADFGEALRAGGPGVVVLDDYPSGSPGRLERDWTSCSITPGGPSASSA